MTALLGQDRSTLEDLLSSHGQPRFRAGQLEKWLYLNVPFENMSNLPKALRQTLRREADEGFLSMRDRLLSSDGTAKYLFGLSDGNAVESVYLPKDYGNSVCVSSQVGCAMGCAFCASGQGGLIRNLTLAEMLGQVTAVQADVGTENRIGNIVVMGMGEPLCNYETLLEFVRRASSPDGLGISQRAITVSTCGVVSGIRRLAEADLQITLAISLHAAIPEKREKIMPSAKGNPLPEIMDAARMYFETTGRRLTFEYALIEGFNDGAEDVQALTNLLSGFSAHVNLIALNAWGGFKAPAKRQVHAFREKLERSGISCTVRQSMGEDIEGACGQLRLRKG